MSLATIVKQAILNPGIHYIEMNLLQIAETCCKLPAGELGKILCQQPIKSKY